MYGWTYLIRKRGCDRGISQDRVKASGQSEEYRPIVLTAIGPSKGLSHSLTHAMPHEGCITQVRNREALEFGTCGGNTRKKNQATNIAREIKTIKPTRSYQVATFTPAPIIKNSVTARTQAEDLEREHAEQLLYAIRLRVTAAEPCCPAKGSSLLECETPRSRIEGLVRARVYQEQAPTSPRLSEFWRCADCDRGANSQPS